ncbi:HAD family hydrolase [Streptomyces millisiae]|uniref:HAD-IA family hydrolase n=1 Tax=Streptomyces millisiae TaxID=3075542 RepID=A0ABU2LH98_9ACTN|nr:HAD-IA family hydrolase [Streptomyces sp. DSM 44918]MDT0316961.1 HAD-IA family hydrolase [Streptomyces sp. DSM 44918]
MTISAVLFDVDGVLLDSAAVHRRAWNSWSLARGLDPEKLWQLTFGRRPEDTVKDAAGHLDPVVERQVLDGLLAQERDSVLPVDGAADLLKELSDSPWAIVTSGDRAFVESRFAAAGLPLPAVRVYGSDVEHAKPAPDCFALAASRLGVAASACLVVEDAPAGISAAVAAGCTVIGVTTTHQEESLRQAHMCAASLTEVRNLLITHGLLART